MTSPGETWGTALVIDASLPLRKALARLLRNAGVRRVIEAGDGTEGVALLRAERVGIVFAPWAPGSSPGRELLSFLRRKGVHRRIPLVLLDEGLPSHTVVAAVKAGVAGILRFPAAGEDLRKLLAELAETAAPRTKE